MTRALILNNDSANTKIKFLYNYGGKIIPRRNNGNLRYIGGHTRVLAVDRSISFTELRVKMLELCGSSMTLKCKLPTEDLDTLISIKSDDDLKNMIEEYDRFSKDAKIIAVLFPIKSLKKISPVSSTEDLCSMTSSAEDLVPRSGAHRRTYNYQTGGGLRQNYRCRVGATPSYRCFVPSSNYCR